MPTRHPTIMHVYCIAGFVRGLLSVCEQFGRFLGTPDARPAVCDNAEGGAAAAAIIALGHLEKALNPERFAWQDRRRFSFSVRRWPTSVMLGVMRLRTLADIIIERWGVPGICDDQMYWLGTKLRYDPGDGSPEIVVNRRPDCLADHEKTQGYSLFESGGNRIWLPRVHPRTRVFDRGL